MVFPCEPTNVNLPFYLQGVSTSQSQNIAPDYVSTGVLTSSDSGNRVWSFQSQGTFTSDTAQLVLDYTKAYDKCPVLVTFSGPVNGTLTVDDQLFSPTKFISYSASEKVVTLTLRVPKKVKRCFPLKTTHTYYFNVSIQSFPTNQCTNCPTPTGEYKNTCGLCSASVEKSSCSISCLCKNNQGLSVPADFTYPCGSQPDLYNCDGTLQSNPC